MDSKPIKEERPWGSFITFAKNTPSTVKILTISSGEAFSLQKHSKRSEAWHIISGSGKITVGDETSDIIVGHDYFIPTNTLHRIEAIQNDVVVLEVSYGDFDESDITRLEDRYNRL